MEQITEKTKFGKIIKYPQLKRVPNGTYYVIQEGHSKDGIKKYASYLKSGKLVLVGAGNSLKEAKTNTLKELNKRLRGVCFIWENPIKKDFNSVLN